MNIHLGERTIAFIDGPNLHATVRALGFEIDYRKLLEHLRKQGQFLRVLYYTAIVEDQEFSTGVVHHKNIVAGAPGQFVRACATR